LLGGVRGVRLVWSLWLPLRLPLLLTVRARLGPSGCRGRSGARLAPMLNRPVFRPDFHVEVVPGEGVFLLSDREQTLLRGRPYELVAPLLDGRTTEEVCSYLRGTATPASVYYALAQLERKGYLWERGGGLPVSEAALWSSQQVSEKAVLERLAQRPVVVGALGMEAGPLLE